MSKNRYSKKIDGNQPKIVEHLLALPGVTVELDHDDIFVGYRGENYWIEIKNPAETLDKDGRVYKGTFEESQVDLMRDWKGQYDVAWSFMDCLEIIEYKP